MGLQEDLRAASPRLGERVVDVLTRHGTDRVLINQIYDNYYKGDLAADYRQFIPKVIIILKSLSKVERLLYGVPDDF